MAKENLFLKKAHEMNLLDERDLCYGVDVVCSNGNRGRAWFFVNGNLMFLYEMRGLADMGACIETLDLNKTKFVKGSSFLLNPNMVLQYAGNTYKITGFAQPKRIIEAFKESCKG